MKYTISLVVFLACHGITNAQSVGLNSFEVSEGYTNYTQTQNLTNSRWTKTGSMNSAAYTYAQESTPGRDGIVSTKNQLLDNSGGPGSYTYQFNSADLGAQPKSLTQGVIQFSIWFCPDTNGDTAFNTSPFETMSFYDSTGKKIVGLGTGNDVGSGELAVYKSLSGAYSNAGKSITANSHAWNRWDITFNLSEKKNGDTVSVDLIRGYGLSKGTAQSEDPAVSIYNKVAVDVDYLNTMKMERNGSGKKYYYDNASIKVVPEPSSTLLLGLSTLGLLLRRKK